MKLLKILIRYLIFNVILFIVYYVLNTLITSLSELTSFKVSGGVTDMVISVTVWLGFAVLYATSSTDRKKYGLDFLALNEKRPQNPLEAFNPISAFKNQHFDLFAYMLLCLPVGAYYFRYGVTTGTNPIIAEIFLPQTLFFKLSGSAILGYFITVFVFYLFSALVQFRSRKKWLAVPLNDDEREGLGLSSDANGDSDAVISDKKDVKRIMTGITIIN